MKASMDRPGFVVAASLLLILLGGSAARPAFGQQAPAEESQGAVIADILSGKAAIRALEAEMAEGVLRQDLSTLRRLWARGFMVNAPRNVVVPNRSAVLDVFRKGIPDYSTFDPHIEAIRIRDGVAVVMGRETVEPVGDAPHAGSTVNRRYTHVWRKPSDRWQLVARHAHIVSIR